MEKKSYFEEVHNKLGRVKGKVSRGRGVFFVLIFLLSLNSFSPLHSCYNVTLMMQLPAVACICGYG